MYVTKASELPLLSPLCFFTPSGPFPVGVLHTLTLVLCMKDDETETSTARCLNFCGSQARTLTYTWANPYCRLLMNRHRAYEDHSMY